MFQTLRNAWKLADLRHKILYTGLIILIYRIGVAIPVPFLDSAQISSLTALTEGSIFQYLNIMSGNALSTATLFALGVSPYITASIVIQLLGVVFPKLGELSKQGEEGQKKINTYTRYATVALALVTSIGYYMLLKNYGLWTKTTFFSAVVIVMCYCAGSALVMWIAEKIDNNGIGNGISMILLANIISRGPAIVSSLWGYLSGPTTTTNASGETVTISHAWGIVIAIAAVLVCVAMVLFIIFMTNSERRLPVQYAKRVVGRKMYGGQSSTLPIKVNNTGVMPIIFASSIVSLPATIAIFCNVKEGSFWDKFFDFLSSGSWFYALMTFILIIAFAYFYVAISFDPVEVSNNLKKNGGFIPGIRPGRPTSDYISKILNRVTLIGAICLGIIAVIPLIINIASGGVLSSLAFSGNSIIIVVGVVLETAREIEAQLTMRHYKGFLD